MNVTKALVECCSKLNMILDCLDLHGSLGLEGMWAAEEVPITQKKYMII